MRTARFIAVNTFVLACIAILWEKGFWQTLPALPEYETIMLAILGAYFLWGMLAIPFDAETGAHLAHSLPIIALGFTGLSVIIAFSQVSGANPAQLLVLMKHLAYSIVPNIVGVLLMGWLRHVMWFAYRQEV